jgi:hypothetical protein
MVGFGHPLNALAQLFSRPGLKMSTLPCARVSTGQSMQASLPMVADAVVVHVHVCRTPSSAFQCTAHQPSTAIRPGATARFQGRPHYSCRRIHGDHLGGNPCNRGQLNGGMLSAIPTRAGSAQLRDGSGAIDVLRLPISPQRPLFSVVRLYTPWMLC